MDTYNLCGLAHPPGSAPSAAAGWPGSPVTCVSARAIEGEHMTDGREHQPSWRTSSASGGTNCVTVATEPTEILVRDSKQHDGAILSFTHEAWRRFVGFLRADG